MDIAWRHQDNISEREALSRNSATSFASCHSRTVQSERDNCDLNILVRRFGVEPLAAPIDPALFGSIDRDLDYVAAHAMVLDAAEAFSRLPAATREAFGNDPVRLLVAVGDSSQHDLLREHGILNPLPEPSRPVVEPDPPAPPAS